MKIEVYNSIKKNSLLLMTDYKSDLLHHDFNDIVKSKECSFLHFTRKMGTYLLKLSTEGFPVEGVKVPYLFGEADRNHLLKQCIDMVKYHNTNCVLIQYYNVDTGIVDIISSDSALSIAQEFTRKTINKWAEERRAKNEC